MRLFSGNGTNSIRDFAGQLKARCRRILSSAAGFLLPHVTTDYSIDRRHPEAEVVARRRLLHRDRRGLLCRRCWRVRAEARSRQDHPARNRATSG